ncbi:MAG: multicopper oxidase domain-containing protein [Bryobacteraceae bacterium]|jgi:FtsP/CotA-like multicopper oxidase with cupredoxin domain
MNRREVLGLLGAATIPVRAFSQSPAKADFTLRIGPVSVELAPKRIVKTTGYNGSSPGPLLRMREGDTVSIDVYNETADPNIVHWHGLFTPSVMDGSMEEGTPMVPAHGQRRYSFTVAPAGTRWYHTHVSAGRNMKRATYTGEFGFLYIEPRNDAGRYDQEVFLALKEWDPYMTTAGEDSGLNVAYKYFSINDRSLGSGEPVRVKEGQRVLFRILNASATMQRRIGLAAHQFQVLAMDGNPVPVQKKTDALEFGPAERIDAVVEMNRPGVWVLGDSNDHDREHGLGIVIEYAGQTGAPRWTPPSDKWDYTAFGNAGGSNQEAERIPLAFEKKFAGSRWVDKWTINGKEFPKTDPIRVRANRRYRLVFDNRSDEAHPVHLHRHSFELVTVEGKPTSGVLKDVVVVGAKSQVEADFVASNPGLTLFHCHQQMHMDYGFMSLMEYV